MFELPATAQRNALVALIAYGFYSGQLRSKAPWDAALERGHAAQQDQGSKEK